MGTHEKGGEKKRQSGWSKGADLTLRVFHIAATGVLFGGMVLLVPWEKLVTWHRLGIATGCALIVCGLFQSKHWPYEGRGLVAAVHIGLIGLLHIRTGFMLPVLSSALVCGVVGSNMPGYLRHWSVVHRRRMDK